MSSQQPQSPHHSTPQEVGTTQRLGLGSPSLRSFSLRSAALFLSSIFTLLPTLLPAAPPPELTVLRQQYDKVIAERVTAPFDAGLAELNTKYSAGLDRAIADAKAAGKLEDILAIESEKKRLTDKLPIPTTDDDKEPESLKRFRGIYRQQLGVITTSRDKTQSDLLPPYTAKLQQLEATLVKNDRVDEAKEVLAYRQGLGTATPAADAPTVAASTTPVAPPSTAPMPATDAPKVKGDDSKAAEWVLDNFKDFRMSLEEGPQIKTKDDLPRGKLALLGLAIDGRTYNGPPLTAETLQVLAGLQKLRFLTFGHFPEASDDTLAFLATLPALEDLKLTKIGAVGGFISHLANMKQLSVFELSELPNFTGIALDQLAALPKLSRLKIWKCKLADEGVMRIPTSLKLEFLDIQSHAGITDASLPHLRQMTSLTRLFLASTQITPEALGDVPMPKIVGLSANEISGLRPNEIMAKIAPAFPNVTEYQITYFVNTPEEFASLAHFKSLTKLGLYGTVNDEAWPGVIELRGLESVDGSGSGKKITDAALASLVSLKKLKTLYLRDSTPSEAALAAFKKARPDVKLPK